MLLSDLCHSFCIPTHINRNDVCILPSSCQTDRFHKYGLVLLLPLTLPHFSQVMRPAPQQTEHALEFPKTLPIASCDDTFIAIARLHSNRTMYSLSGDARQLVNLINEEFITGVNAVISEGRSPPKTKKVDMSFNWHPVFTFLT